MHKNNHVRNAAFLAAWTLMMSLAVHAADNNGVQKVDQRETLQGFFFQGPDEASVERLLNTWPVTPRQAAKVMVEKYGQPHEATPTMLVWHNNGPWKHTIVYREEIVHNFPRPHSDVIEQVIDYKVPANKFDDLARYDGSVIADRTKGELKARSDKEEMNFLTLNLADDIVKGKKSADEARREYSRAAVLSMTGKSSELLEKLQFNVSGDTMDKDKSIIKEITE